MFLWQAWEEVTRTPFFQNNTAAKSWRLQEPHCLAEHMHNPDSQCLIFYLLPPAYKTEQSKFASLKSTDTENIPLEFRLAIFSLIQAETSHKSVW